MLICLGVALIFLIQLHFCKNFYFVVFSNYSPKCIFNVILSRCFFPALSLSNDFTVICCLLHSVTTRNGGLIQQFSIKKLFGFATTDIRSTEFSKCPKQPHKPPVSMSSRDQRTVFHRHHERLDFTKLPSIGCRLMAVSVKIPIRDLVSSPNQEKVTDGYATWVEAFHQ